MATIEIDGKSYQVDNGRMIIEVTDELGIPIPRFCYHKKLSVAANCRMCLVQVENSRKPVPACATPITDGMKVHTQSEETIRSQKAVMEFLLINHPLDCPVCDQGGECELQDVSLGYGMNESEYLENKRSVNDDNLGTLIATEMTRCIHCTRCVRFGEEIAGVRELGATGRGEKTQIGTYVNHAMTSEVSGNIIDLCPVGALTSKPFRFTARPWELTQFDTVAPHDCLGSAVHVHVRRQQVMRVVPRENEQINETWISDRDRFSYLGLTHPHRAKFPRIKQNGQWQTVDWSTALEFTAQSIAQCIKLHGDDQFAAFCSPSSTLEEMYLLQRWMRGLGVAHLDHRLLQTDVRDQNHEEYSPSSTLLYAELEKQQTILLVGSHLHREVPLAGVRVRKAVASGSEVFSINPVDYLFPFQVKDKLIVGPSALVSALGQVLLACVDKTDILPPEIRALLEGIEVNDASKAMAVALQNEHAVIVTGSIVENHPEASILRTLIYYISQHTSAKLLRLTLGSNTKGAWISGMIPHRSAGSVFIEEPGLAAYESIEKQLKGYCLLGVEPGFDFAHPAAAKKAMNNAECVVMITAYDTPEMEEYATVILPMGIFTETSGTYVNINDHWQSVKGCSALPGEARPAWKILRVLANLMALPGFEYESTEQVVSEVRDLVGRSQTQQYQPFLPKERSIKATSGLMRINEWPLYGVDSLVRHADDLQLSASADSRTAQIHPETAYELGLSEQITIAVEENEVTLPLVFDEVVSKGSLRVLSGHSSTSNLGYPFAELRLVNK